MKNILLTVAGIGIAMSAQASYPTTPFPTIPAAGGGAILTSIAAAPGEYWFSAHGGFWVQVDSFFGKYPGGTFANEGAPTFENVPVRGTIASIPGRKGYWVVTEDGTIHARGDAPQLCDGLLSACSGYPKLPLAYHVIVAAAATPSGLGLWAVDRMGGVWTAGDAQSYGNATGEIGAVPTGIAATPSGKGYYIVKNDGGVFAFGDAVFHGSTGGNPPAGRKITGMALSFDDWGKVNGYWLVGEDGGIHTFGYAPFWGSSGGDNGGNRVTGIVSFPAPDSTARSQATRGYAWVFEHGQVAAVYRP
jgi:hypothetical protein